MVQDGKKMVERYVRSLTGSGRCEVLFRLRIGPAGLLYRQEDNAKWLGVKE